MHLYHIINQFNQLYGKRQKQIGFRFSSEYIYVTLYYGSKETVMMRIWIEDTSSNDPLSTEKTYRYVLWHDGIYTNEYLMPDPEKMKHLYQTVQQLSENPADYRLGYWIIDPPDNKLLRIWYWTNRHQMLEIMNDLQHANCFTKDSEYQYQKTRYNDALKDLPFRIAMEQHFKTLIQARNLPEKPTRKAVSTVKGE